MRRIGLVSSGTGGHLWPALTLSLALERAGHETAMLTEGRQVERELLDRAGRGADYLPIGGRGPGKAVGFASAVLEARRWLGRQGIEALVLTGGRTALAAGLAGRSKGIPIYLLEQNVVRGRANKILAPLARRIYQGLPVGSESEASSRRAVGGGRRIYTGTPLRESFLAGRDAGACDFGDQDLDDRAPGDQNWAGDGSIVDRRSRARRQLGLPVGRSLVFVTGGSQGASSLNEVAPEALLRAQSRLKSAGVDEPLVCHLAGPGREQSVREAYAAAGIEARVEALTEDMPVYYAAADLVLCRGGGVTIAELIATGRGAIVIPYPYHSDRQQFHNARVLETVGAARIVEERPARSPGSEATARANLIDRLVDPLVELLADRELRARMELAAVQLDPGDASERIVEDLCESLGEAPRRTESERPSAAPRPSTSDREQHQELRP